MSNSDGALVHEPDAPDDVDGESPDTAYLTPKAVNDWIAKQSDHQLEQIWRTHNFKAQWVPTIKYPPGFADKLSAFARETLKQTAFVEDLTNWLVSCRKVWSVGNAAKFIIRLAYSDALRRLVVPIKEPVKLTKPVAPAQKAANDPRPQTK